jgi:hypothetical protein
VADIALYFDVAGDWVCPADVTSLDRLLITLPGGGGAGGTNGGLNGGGAGGGSGFSTSVAVTPASTYSILIGTGGTGGTNAGTAGQGGQGETSFAGGPEAYTSDTFGWPSGGGPGGTVLAAGAGDSAPFPNSTDDTDTGGNGGRVGSGTSGGGGGGGAGMDANGGDASGATAGVGGNAVDVADPGYQLGNIGGGGGNGGANGASGTNGVAPGGGGGGAGTGTGLHGGNGANGRVWLRYTSATLPGVGFTLIRTTAASVKVYAKLGSTPVSMTVYETSVKQRQCGQLLHVSLTGATASSAADFTVSEGWLSGGDFSDTANPILIYNGSGASPPTITLTHVASSQAATLTLVGWRQRFVSAPHRIRRAGF